MMFTSGSHSEFEALMKGIPFYDKRPSNCELLHPQCRHCKKYDAIFHRCRYCRCPYEA